MLLYYHYIHTYVRYFIIIIIYYGPFFNVCCLNIMIFYMPIMFIIIFDIGTIAVPFWYKLIDY